MKHYLFLFAVLLLSACTISPSGSPSPADSLPENSFAGRPALDPSPALNLFTGEEIGPGNAGIALAGYDPLYVTDALPDSARTGVLSAYNEVTSVPGRINAAMMREKFCPPPVPAAVRPPATPVLVSLPQQEGR